MTDWTNLRKNKKENQIYGEWRSWFLNPVDTADE